MFQEDHGHRVNLDHLFVPLLHSPLADLSLPQIHKDLGVPLDLILPEGLDPPSDPQTLSCQVLPPGLDLHVDLVDQVVPQGPVELEEYYRSP